MILPWLFVAFIVVVITYWYHKYFKYEKYLKKYPGPTPLPLLGNALEVASTSEVLWVFVDLVKRYGGIVKSRMGFDAPNLLITDVKLTEFVLSSTKILAKSRDYEYLHSWLGSGLLTSSGEKWKRHRKMLTPAFHFQILEQFLDVFNLYSDIMIGKLKKEVGKNSTNIYPYITLCSLDIVCASSMGTEVNAQKDQESNYVHSVKEMCRIVIERVTSVIKSSHILYKLTNDYRIEKDALKILHNYTNQVIQTRKQTLASTVKSEESNIDDLGIKKRKTFLDLLLQQKIEGNILSDTDIREEVDTFMFEGHDTTSAGISFALYCLANNPDVQKTAVDELKDIFGDDQTRDPVHKDLQDMKYIEQVIKETLRLYPSVPIFARSLSQDVEYDGEIIPKNVSLSIFPFGIHRSPENYPDPEKFDPDRFTTENQAKRSPYAYIPFSAGPRNCIGQRFAMLEMKSIISKILRNFELLPAKPQKELQLVGETILKSKNGVHVQLKKRQYV